MDQVLDFLIFDKHEYTHGILRSIILVSIFVTGLCNFFFVPQYLITSQVFPDENKQSSLEWRCIYL